MRKRSEFQEIHPGNMKENQSWKILKKIRVLRQQQGIQKEKNVQNMTFTKKTKNQNTKTKTKIKKQPLVKIKQNKLLPPSQAGNS